MKLIISQNIFVQDLGDSLALLNLENDQSFRLEQLGAVIWSCLSNDRTVEATFDLIRDQYEVEPEQLLQDLNSFILQLSNHGLLKVTEA